ncbi:MAG: tetratricopeptide repeat protein [Candidatus Thermoplasmatota archaeon]|nr:tetratricopeptide repeat protein [Candidatus Thermoplasmatota archaeon]
MICIFCGSEGQDAVCATCGESIHESSPVTFLPALPTKTGISDHSWRSGSLLVVLSSPKSMRTEAFPPAVLDGSSGEKRAHDSLLRIVGMPEACGLGTYPLLSSEERENLSQILRLKPTREKGDETLMRIGSLHYLLAMGLDGLGEWAGPKKDEHLKIAKRAFSRAKSNILARRNLALVYLESGDDKKAMKHVDEALKELRKDAELWTAKGVLLHRTDQLEESLKCLDRALNLNEDDPRIWTARGALLVDMSELERAVECFDEAIVRDRMFIRAWREKIDVLLRLGREGEALEVSEVLHDMVSTGESIEQPSEAPEPVDLPEDESALINPLEVAVAREEILDILLQVDGIGESKAETLFAHGIDSINGLRKASLEDLAQVKGISQKIAENIKEMIKSEPTEGPQGRDERTEKTMESARDYLEQGDYEKALAEYDSVLESDPRNEDGWFNKAELLQALGKSREAVEAFDTVISINEKNTGAWMEKANTLLEMGKPLDAVECYRNILEMESDNTSYLVARAKILAEDGNHEAAILCYDIVLDRSPKNTDANLGVIFSLFELGDLDRAEQILDRLARLTSLNEKVWWARGYLMDKRGRWGAAIQFYDRAISLKWNYPDPWTGKGDILLRQGKYEEAKRCFEKVLEMDGENIDAWLGKAEALDWMGQRIQAMEWLDDLLEVHPDHEKALEMMSKLRSIEPGDRESYLRTARAQRQTSDYENAADTIVKAIKENPNEEDVWTLLGDILLDVADPIKLLNKLERETSRMPNDPDMLVNKGALLLRLGMYANALKCFDKALSIDENHERAGRLRERCMEETEKVI